MPDLFLDSDDVSIEDLDRFKQKKAVKQGGSGADEISSLFEKIRSFCNEDVVSTTQAIYQFNVADVGPWYLDLKTASGNVSKTL